MFVVIIPARFASQRLPGKALVDINGKPMIQHVYERARQSAAADVVVATDDSRIRDVVQAFGGKALMTSALHPSGTDRLQEAASLLGLADDEIVVNVQGDEPLVPPLVIDQVANNLTAAGTAMATLYEPMELPEDIRDPNKVKVVTDAAGRALLFSRAAIPFDRDGGSGYTFKRHLGIYAYRVSLLREFVQWPPCELEQTEKLEQLRAMWHGRTIHVDRAAALIPPGVDTPADLKRVREAMRHGD
ncbi:MAG: 3-deoxy-manno-octulosonate cytidylyltransferase [Pseudomonadota bacterium]